MITLFKNRQVTSRIVLSPTVGPSGHRAAREFQRIAKRMGGVEIPILEEPDRPAVNEAGRSPGGHETETGRVYIGWAPAELDVDLSESALGYDGYVIRCTGNDLVLAGRRPYSALYAVYRLFEEHLGCGFFEEGEQIPYRETVSIGDLNGTEICHRPRFKWRMYFANMQDAYSGMRWWTWEEFRPWVDYLVKKRFNILESGNIADCCGIGALAANQLGVPVQLADWQRERIALLRRVFDYAREAGIRIRYRMQLHVGTPAVNPGFSPYADGRQLQEFVDGYEAMTGEKIRVAPLEWCGESEIVLDPRDPVTRRFTTAVVESYAEALGTDHLYSLWLPTEETWVEENPDRAAELTHASVDGMIQAIRDGDPDAVLFSPRVCTDNPTAAAQARAVRDAGLPVIGNMFLNHAGRMYDFLRCDYYWGLPWSTGMCGQCGRETNPNGDIRTAIDNARSLADHPRASNLQGFMVSSETNHRNVMTMDLYAELSWNPADLEPDAYVEQWNRRRYGPAAEETRPAVRIFAETIMAYFDPCTHNGPLYRNWDGTLLPGLTSGSVKRLIGFLPALHDMLEILLSQYDALEDSPMYRFDLVDIGRTYLAGIFNHRLAEARKAFRAGDRERFERMAGETERVMLAMARYCSAHEQFRLKTHDGWAARWPEIVPGHANSESNWITFTALISLENWQVLLDYLPEDFAEMIVHYFLPRVRQYLDRMRTLMDRGEDISERLVDRDSDVDLPSRVANWSTPRGNAPWSPYGDTCEPELTGEDEALALRLIKAGSVSGRRYDFYEGPLDALVREMLGAFPPPGEIEEILAEEDYAPPGHRLVLHGMPGETIEGFNVPGFVERVEVPRELRGIIAVREVRREYNIARGEIAMYQVTVPPEIDLIRREDEPAPSDGHNVAVFTFSAGGAAYKVWFDSGTDLDVASFVVKRSPASR
ncbi:MAG: alpha-N-acetylglucosaminidase C-terminal domain-containing protein [Gemmatimonadota bacterium]|nr:alpha-N-acetylglucosaminidase C-terminal domain-containing protein [Gemmatimonadota bacterium]